MAVNSKDSQPRQPFHYTNNTSDVQEVCSAWSRIGELWEAATDEEREVLMQAFVCKIEMTEKEQRTCEISLFLPQAPECCLELTSKMGALARLITTYPSILATTKPAYSFLQAGC